MIRSPVSTNCRESGFSAEHAIDYTTLKMIHVTCAAASYMLFLVRGVWMVLESPLLRKRWVRTVPHLIDTVLLASAIAMAVAIRQYPFSADWLTAKLLALLCYMGLGMIALKFGRRRGVRLGAWLAAQAVFFLHYRRSNHA